MTTDSPSGSTRSPASPESPGVTVVVCHSCRGPDGSDDYPRPGSRLADDARRAADGADVRVRSVGCLGNCKRGMSAAILSEGSWSYIFGWLNEQSGEDLVAGAALLAESQDGFMPFRARPESLKRGLIARIPTLGHLGEEE
jgi:predicted metal-binding protein